MLSTEQEVQPCTLPTTTFLSSSSTRDLNKTEFAREVGISSNTLAKLSKNELVSLEVLVRICRQLDCSLGDIVQIAPSEAPIKNGLERRKKRTQSREKGGSSLYHE